MGRNRAELARRIGIEPFELFGLRAVHAGQVGLIDSGARSARRSAVGRAGVRSGARVDPGWNDPQVDALVTAIPGIGLLALAADCAAVALADPDAGVVAVLHCGWKGLIADVAANTVTAMYQAGAERVQAVIGPTICAACYRVDAARALQVRRHCESAAVRRGGDWSIDIGVGLTSQLRAQGVWVRRIEVCPSCGAVASGPAPDPAGYFSYRRDGLTGRHGMAVTLRPERQLHDLDPGTIGL